MKIDREQEYNSACSTLIIVEHSSRMNKVEKYVLSSVVMIMMKAEIGIELSDPLEFC